MFVQLHNSNADLALVIDIYAYTRRYSTFVILQHSIRLMGGQMGGQKDGLDLLQLCNADQIGHLRM
jgi:hypothetical protein